MHIEQLISMCNAAIPRDQEWIRERGESYGAFGMTSLKRKDVKRVLFCVSATPEVVKYFHQHRYDLLISHHPFVRHDVPMLVYHTALDCCPGGLNDFWRDALGVQDAKHFDGTLGWSGAVSPLQFSVLVEKIRTIAGDVIGQTFCRDDQPIQSVVICTGLGGMVTEEAATSGADCYVTGQLFGASDKLKFRAVVEIGHTLSERCGFDVFHRLLTPHGVKVDIAPLNLDVFGLEVANINRAVSF